LGFGPLFERAFVFRVQLGAYRRDQLVHQLRCLILHFVVEVTVDVHGDAGLGMSQYLRDNDHRDAVIEHQRSRRVAQIMEADLRQTSLL